MSNRDGIHVHTGRRGRGIQHPAYLNGRRRGTYEARYSAANELADREPPG